MNVSIGGRSVGPGEPTFVVAEMAWSHEGSLEKARKIVSAAANARADAVNFHVTSLPNYMVRSYGHRDSAESDQRAAYDFLESISLSFDDWKVLSREARESDLLVSAMCNDLPSLEFATAELNPSLLMIHPSCAADTSYTRKAAGQALPIVLYMGGLTLGEVERAIDEIRRGGNEQILLLHGFQGFPTPLEENDIRRMTTLQDLFGLPVGFADHTDGADDYALTLPCVAIGAGACFLEKHLTHDREVRGVDFEAALGPARFAAFVDGVRKTDIALGIAQWKPLTDLQSRYRMTVRKRAVVAADLPAGHQLSTRDVVYKRAPDGLLPEEVVFAIGRSLAKDAATDQPITLEMFE